MTVCVCQKPFNPDNLLLYCGICDVWLHDECFIDVLVKRLAPRMAWTRISHMIKYGQAFLALPSMFEMESPEGYTWTIEVRKDGVFVIESHSDSFQPSRKGHLRCIRCDREI